MIKHLSNSTLTISNRLEDLDQSISSLIESKSLRLLQKFDTLFNQIKDKTNNIENTVELNNNILNKYVINFDDFFELFRDVSDKNRNLICDIHKFSSILPQLDYKSIDKCEIIKMFENLTCIIDERVERLNIMLSKQNDIIFSIKNSLNDTEVQNKFNINYVNGISNIYSIPEKIDNQIDLFNKI